MMGAAAGDPEGGGTVGKTPAKVTLRSIAESVGVSQMTVSNAFSRPEKLSAALRERILAVADEMGYAGPDPSARALARGRTATVGLVITETLSEAFADPVATEFLAAVGDTLGDHGYALTLITGSRSTDLVPARDTSMDGAIVYVCEHGSDDVAWLRRRGLPLVSVDQDVDPGTPSVNVEDRAGARAAAQHLVDLGHRRIGLLNNAPLGEGGENPPSRERDLGWRDALEEAGVEITEERSTFSPRSEIEEAARRLLTRPDRPTALLCFSDVFAVQALRAAHALGLTVPDDVSIVGFDDSPLASAVVPALTTVRQPVGRKGRLAVEALLAALAGDEAAVPHVVLPTELVVRDSSAPPRP